MTEHTRRFISLAFIILCLLNFKEACSQVSVPGTPLSFSVKTKKTAVLPFKMLEKIDTAFLVKEDNENGIPNRYSIIQPLSVDIKQDGLKSEINGKGYIWRYKIIASEAYSLGVWFSSYVLPKDALLYIYDDNHTIILGAFSSLNNNASKQLSIAELRGKNLIIEYYEPYGISNEGQLVLGSVSQAYRDITDLLSGIDRIGINCSQGEPWQDEKHAVCRMTYTIGVYGYYCTGFLINNVRQDGTPYFMTANHCISTNAVAASLITYFNYENSSCSSDDASIVQTLSGARLTASNIESDFSLLLLNEVPPMSYKAYLAGWEAGSRIPQSGTSIHHPGGSPKSIAIDNNALTSYTGRISWDDGYVSQANTHWSVKYDIGDTEGGSSGSPIFDDNSRVVGQLHGSNQTQSFYGKLSVSWANSSAGEKQLKAWLDPDNTGITSLDGFYLIKPVSAFAAEYPQICINTNTILFDQSANMPQSWIWKITPESYHFVNGTSATSQNPEVVFTKTGSYSVELITANIYGKDTLISPDFIKVVDHLDVSFTGVPADSAICGCDLSEFSLIAKGASRYDFSLDRLDKIDYSVGSDTMTLMLRDDQKKYGSFNAMLKVTGHVGTCKDNDSVMLKVIMPPNDDVENATRLWLGNNGSFSNICASAEENEPTPPDNSCYSNDGWCPVRGSNKVNNSIWFNFIGPSNGRITIDTRNLNNRIAVYKANSHEDIESGNAALYEIIAANDDRSESDYSSLIENLEVRPGAVYWLQVDGSKGATGDVSIALLSNSLEVFPNPSDGNFETIISSISEAKAQVKIFSDLGQLMFEKQVFISPDSNRFDFDLTPFPPGIYYMHVNVGGNILKSKVVLVK